MKLADRVIIVTGGAAGIGAAMAQRFARDGARVVIGDVLADESEQTVAAIHEAGGEACCVVGDCAESAGADRLVDTAISRYGKLDILCNNAGVLDGLTPLAECSDELWDRVLRINLKGSIVATNSLLETAKPVKAITFIIPGIKIISINLEGFIEKVDSLLIMPQVV